MATQVVDGEFTGKQIQQDQHSQRCRAWALPAPGKGRGHSRGGQPPGPAHRCLGALGGGLCSPWKEGPWGGSLLGLRRSEGGGVGI